MTEQEILKLAFNQGYELQKSDPNLAARIASSFSDPSVPYADGFISGAVEFIKEIGQSPDEYISLITKSKDRDQSIQR